VSPTGRRGKGPAGDDSGSTGLTGGGPSQLSVIVAMRARDVSRATAADLERAERIVQVSYRPHSRPPAPKPHPPAGTTQPVTTPPVTTPPSDHETDGSSPVAS
jgi:hypothetical protein